MSRVRRLPCEGHAARLAERGVADIDAPVSGGTAGAGAGTLDDVDRLGRAVHCPVDLMPSGRFPMEDFYSVGGLPVVPHVAPEASAGGPLAFLPW